MTDTLDHPGSTDPDHDLLAAPAAGRGRGGPPVQPLGPVGALLGLILLLAVGLGFGLLFGIGHQHLGSNAIMIGAAAAGVVVALTAAARFWVVVVGLFVLRSSLDALKLDHFSDGSNALDPGVVVGLVFLAGGAAWLVAQWRSGNLRPVSAPTRWFLALAAAGSLSAMGSAGMVSSFQVSLKIWAGALMLAVLEQAYQQDPRRIRHILVAGAAALVVPALVSLQQLSGPQEVEAYLEVSRIRGTFVHSNPFATFLVILAVVGLAVRPHLDRWARVAANLVVGVAAVLTLFTYARGAWIALFLGVVVIGVCQDKRLLLLVLAVTVGALLFVPSVSSRLSDLTETQQVGNGDPNSFAWRVRYWERLLPMTAENPVTGIGLDQVLERSPEKLMPHNTLVQALVETGLLGLSALLGLIVSTGAVLARTVRRLPPGLDRGIAVGAAAAGLGWFVQLGSENLLTQAAIFWYLAGPLAWVLVLRHRQDEADAAARPAPPAWTLEGFGEREHEPEPA